MVPLVDAPVTTVTPGTRANAQQAAMPQQTTLQEAAVKDASKPGADSTFPDATRARTLARLPVPVPNQFQRFVQGATGRLLPIYGHNLFDTPQAYAADAALPAPADYVLGAGDEVRLQVWGPVDFNTSLTVDRNGQVNLPKVGVLTLAGVPVRDLEKTLRTHLGKVFTNFQASASMGRLRGIQVYVVGQAQLPGTYHLSSLSTLVNALFASGGPNANGSMRNIELKRAGQTISTLDLYEFIARGDKTRDLPLLSGDVIVIPPVGPRVAVAGAFDQAAIYELKASATSVGDILTLGGGVPALAKSQKALLERISRDSKPPRQVQEIVLDDKGLRQPLIDGDVLTLLDISPAFANAVTLQGVVAEPLRYRWFEGMKILDLIPDREALITGDYYRRKNLLVQKSDNTKEAGSNLDSRIRNLADQINWEYAVIERMDRNKLSTELIPFNLGKAVLQHDPANNLALHAGDVVTILSQMDLRLPQDRQARLVRVEGEVTAPGVYQAAPGETLPQLLQRIGGLTPQAYLFGAEFNRESVRARQQENLDVLIRRMETQSQSQAGVLIANRGTDSAGQALALQQQQQAQLKSQIERLKSVKSNGRVALELDPQAHALANLPALPLEDGDHILVPSTPGFVSAFGSVNNENVFIYRPGKTVGDVIKSAGLTEDAEPDQAFVLRADGSIMARRDHSGYFGGSFESIQVMPGDTLVVPAQIDRESRYNMITRAVKDWSQILSNFGLGIASLRAATKL
jgi:protein involved in polysaccharide export with SLBB domain